MLYRTVYNSKDLEPVQMPIDDRLDRENAIISTELGLKDTSDEKRTPGIFIISTTQKIMYDNKDVIYKDVVTKLQQRTLQKMPELATLNMNMIILEKIEMEFRNVSQAGLEFLTS
ncbi:hypothetical protein AAY473_036944, partial [Plecturocebus cupreus]